LNRAEFGTILEVMNPVYVPATGIDAWRTRLRLMTSIVLLLNTSCSQEQTEAPKPTGPTQALIEKAVHQWVGRQNLPMTSSKRGATLVSSAGGVLPENTTVFPVQIELGDSGNPRTGGMTVVLYFFQDEFEQWQFFSKDSPEHVLRVE
jgi:hypothetical protein